MIPGNHSALPRGAGRPGRPVIPSLDYPAKGFRYTGTETVGPAGDYLRTTRRSTEPLPGHFIKTPVDVPLYVVSVEIRRPAMEELPHPGVRYRTQWSRSRYPLPRRRPGSR